MKKVNFLNKIKKERKLELVEPSKEICKSYLEKSNNSIKSAELLLTNKLYENSVSMSYYSMYYMLLALLFNAGIKCENHSASIILLKDIFDIDNSDIYFAKKERVDKQYYVDFNVNKQEVLDLIEKTKEFNRNLFDFISKLSNEQIKNYRNKFKEIFQ